jgi:beta-glucanase (GH16 family)
MKRNYKWLLCCAPALSLLLSCSKSGGTPPATPTDLVYSVQVVGVTDATPNGNGSGKVTLTLSGKNVTSFIVTLPTEGTSQSVNGPSGTATLTFSSAPNTTKQYPIEIAAYCNTVSVDTTIYVTVATGTPAAPGTELMWSDEFNGTSLNTSIWNYEIGNLGVNNEVEYYTSDPANVSVQNGYLQITALNSPNYNGKGYNYTSARINTEGNYSFTYGKVDMRAQIPGDPGTWPALWMLGNTINSTGWPGCGEIDIMEAATNTWGANMGSSLHWQGGNTNKQLAVPGMTTGFHDYVMDWRADHIAFYVDGVKVDSVANNSSMPFNQPFFFIFNVAVGGDMGGTPITLGSNSTMYVDYVRVYN